MPTGSGISAQLGVAEEVYTNEQQTITGAAGGAWTLNFDGAVTTSLASTETAGNIQTALQALPNIGTNGATASGGPLGTSAVTVTFSGALVQKRDVPLLISSLGANPVIATSVPGTGYGNYVAPATYNEFVDENILLAIDRVETKGLRAGNFVLRSDRWAANKRGAAGDIDLEFASKAMGKWLKYMTGAAPVITTPTNGVLARQFRNQMSDQYQQSLCVQIGRPDTTGTVRAFSYVGGKVVGWELSNTLDGLLALKLNMDFKDEDTTQTLGTASYASAFELLYFSQGQITIGGANVDVRSFDLKMTNGLKTDRYFIRNDTRKKEPIRNALADISGSIEAEFTDLAAYNRFVNGTTAQITAVWKGSLIETVAGPNSYFNQLTVTLPCVRFDGETPDAGGPDVITQTLPFQVLNDGSGLAPITLDWMTTDTAV